MTTVSVTACLLGVILLATPATLRGQAGPRPAGQGAAVVGTLYLVTPHGERRPAPGRSIALLADSDTLRAGLDDVCRAHRAGTRAFEDSLERVRKQVADTTHDPTDDPWTVYWEHEVDIRESKIAARELLLSSSVEKLRRLLGLAQVDSTRAGADASFRLSAPGSGRYILFGEWVQDNVAYRWWQPLDLPADASLRHTISGAAASLEHPFCEPR